MPKLGDISSHSTKGFLPIHMKKEISREKLDSKYKSKLINKKNGILIKKLEYIVDDFEFLIIENNSRFLLLDYTISKQLKKLEALLQNHFSNTFAPQFRISAITKTDKKTKLKTRLFKLKGINYSRNKEMGLIRGKEMNRGLKNNEIKMINKYIKKCGVNFPLEENKEYSWLKTKEILKNQMNSNLSKIHNKEEEKIRRRKKLAWKIIKKQIDLNELIQKTGCGLKVIYEGDPKNIGFKP